MEEDIDTGSNEIKVSCPGNIKEFLGFYIPWNIKEQKR